MQISSEWYWGGIPKNAEEELEKCRKSCANQGRIVRVCF